MAYGPEAILLTLVSAGAAAVRWTLPISAAIAVLLLVLVISYRQVIAVHPDGGGAYAVAKKDLSPGVSLLAAASLVVDYVLTVAVSLAAGAASLGSVFPVLSHHLLAVTMAGLAALTIINLIGIAESAKVLMGPTVLFITGIVAIIVVGLIRPHPVATIGSDLGSIHATEALSLVVILKAFAAGCSSLTGVEAIANAVPAFRTPRVKRAQRCEVALGVLLGGMLIGLSAQIRLHHVVPRGGVTVLAQLSAGAGNRVVVLCDQPVGDPGPGTGRQHQLRRPTRAAAAARQGPQDAPPVCAALRTPRVPLRRRDGGGARRRATVRRRRPHP